MRKHIDKKSGVGFIAALIAYMAADSLAADPAAEFSTTNNPNPPWIFGYTDFIGGGLHVFPDVTSLQNGGIIGWQLISFEPYLGVYKNITSHPISGDSSVIQAGQMTLYPGPFGQLALVRYIVPKTTTFNINATFVGIDLASTDVHILFNNASIGDGAISGFGNESKFTLTVSASQGQTIDLAVGNGGNGHAYDSTGLLDTTISIGGDANRDDKVDVNDLNILASHWHSASANWTNGDFDGDGHVDSADLGILAVNWGGSASFAEALGAISPALVPEPSPHWSALSAATLRMLGFRRRARASADTLAEAASGS